MHLAALWVLRPCISRQAGKEAVSYGFLEKNHHLAEIFNRSSRLAGSARASKAKIMDCIGRLIEHREDEACPAKKVLGQRSSIPASFQRVSFAYHSISLSSMESEADESSLIDNVDGSTVRLLGPDAPIIIRHRTRVSTGGASTHSLNEADLQVRNKLFHRFTICNLSWNTCLFGLKSGLLIEP